MLKLRRLNDVSNKTRKIPNFFTEANLFKHTKSIKIMSLKKMMIVSP